jgi:hypothetical protein
MTTTCSWAMLRDTRHIRMSGELPSKAETARGSGLGNDREGMCTLGEEESVEFKAFVCGLRARILADADADADLTRRIALTCHLDSFKVNTGTVADKQGHSRPVSHVDVIPEHTLNTLLACNCEPCLPTKTANRSVSSLCMSVCTKTRYFCYSPAPLSSNTCYSCPTSSWRPSPGHRPSAATSPG